MDKLSNELLVNVLSHVDGPVNLANFCDAMPRCQPLAESFFKRYIENYYYTGVQSLRNFIRFMLHYEYLRAYVKSVDFDEGHRKPAIEDWWGQLTPDAQGGGVEHELLKILYNAGFPEKDPSTYESSVYEVVQKLDSEPGLDERYAEWTDDRTRRDALAALLLTLLPNVQNMHVNDWHSEQFIDHLFQQATKFLIKAREQQVSTPPHLRGLLTLKQYSCFYSQADNGEGGSDIARFIPFLYLPRLSRIDGLMITSYEEEEDIEMRDDFCQNWDTNNKPWKYGFPVALKGTSSVTSLSFCHSTIDLSHLEKFIQVLKGLESFNYTYGGFIVLSDLCREMTEGERFVAAKINAMLLRHAKTTLVSLSLHAYNDQFGDFDSFDEAASASSAWMGSVRHYQTLKHLSVPLTFLLGRTDVPRTYRLIDILPQTLESLCIYHFYYYRNEDDIWGPRDYIPHLTEVLENKAGVVPRFKELELHASDDPVFDELRQACSAANVELKLSADDKLTVEQRNVQDIARAHGW